MTTKLNFPAAVFALLTAGPVAAQRPVPLQPMGEKPALRTALMAGPPPGGVTVSGTPALARVLWTPGGASFYTVQRWMQNHPDCCRASSPQIAGTAEGWWEDPLPPRPGTYVYRVTAIHADGRQGFVDVNFLRPEPSNPAVLTPRLVTVIPAHGGYGVMYYIITVKLEWSIVPMASFYMLWGPGLPNTGVRLDNTVSMFAEAHQTSYQVQSGNSSNVEFEWGLNTWTIGAFFLPGPVSTAAASFTKGSVNVPEPRKP